MRIVGGAWRGLVLTPLGKGDPSAHLRPTADRVRESLFNMLIHGDYPTLEGARVLDLFAGTGALGLEALSRGAKFVMFIDNSPKSIRLVERNLERVGAKRNARIHRGDATKLGACSGAPFDWVFLDPPYGKFLGEKAINSAMAKGWLRHNTMIVWEENAPPELARALRLCTQRRFGDSWITIAQYQDDVL